MKSLKKIELEIAVTGQIKTIVEVYEEVSATKMKEIRDEILKSRDFLERLADLSVDVGSDFSSATDQKPENAAVYISPDKGLYGDLPEKVFMTFLQFVESESVKPIIFGKQGKIFVNKYRPKLPHLYYDNIKGKSSEQTLTSMMNILLEYGKVTMFYGKFRNLVSQNPQMESLSSGFLKDAPEGKKKESFQNRLKFIYEPDIETVSEKFANEIKTSVLEGMMKEDELARTASRMMHLDQAYEKIVKKAALLQLVKNRERKKLEDKKQQERIKRLII